MVQRFFPLHVPCNYMACTFSEEISSFCSGTSWYQHLSWQIQSGFSKLFSFLEHSAWNVPPICAWKYWQFLLWYFLVPNTLLVKISHSTEIFSLTCAAQIFGMYLQMLMLYISIQLNIVAYLPYESLAIIAINVQRYLHKNYS